MTRTNVLDSEEGTPWSSPDQELTTASKRVLRNSSSVTKLLLDWTVIHVKFSIYKHWTGFTIKKQITDHWHFSCYAFCLP